MWFIEEVNGLSLVEFELPEEIRGVTYETILAQMLSQVPDRYDKLEGGFVYDMIAPSAFEAAEIVEFWLPIALKMMSHIWATGRWLDYHAHDCGLERREPTFAYGNVEVVTTQAVTFPKGFIFSVPSEDSSPAIEFETLEKISADEPTTLTIRVRAVEAGTNSNVRRDSITIMKNPLKGVESITNPDAMTGGTAEEDDESLRARIDDFYAGRGASFVGNRRDYERWAKEVAGVGFAHCIPTFDGANTVKIVIADANGDPANAEILRAIELHIFGEGHDDISRLAPIGIVRYEVAAPNLVPINLTLNAKISADATTESASRSIEDALKNYFKTLADDSNQFGTLKFVEVVALLTKIPSLEDFKHIRVNGSRENISFAEDEMPSVGAVELTAYD